MKKKIKIIGDSISVHYGKYISKLLEPVYSCVLMEGQRQALGNLDTPMGGNGGDSSMVLDYLTRQSAAAGLEYDIMLLNCGLHDIKTDPSTGNIQVPVGLYAKNLEEIIDLLKRNKVLPIWIRTTPVNDEQHKLVSQFNRYSADVHNYNNIADKIMCRCGINIIDLFTFTSTFGRDGYCDHVHYKEEVRIAQASFIAGNLYCLSNYFKWN